MIDVIRRKPKDVFSVGVNAHPLVDNLITLSRSSNDLFDGTIDYIFFKVLNCDPIAYSNICEIELDEEVIEELQFNYEEYDKKYKNFTNFTIVEQLEKVVEYIRSAAIEEGRIIEFTKDIYTSDEIKFDSVYILKKMFKFFKKAELTIPTLNVQEEVVGKLICLIGPSGSGKSTIEKSVYPLLKRFVSVTTRPRRDGEEDGKDYYFFSKEKYQQLLEKDEFVETVEYAGNRYGFLKSEFEKLKTDNLITALTWEGYESISEIIGSDAIPVFVDTDLVKRVDKLMKRACTVEEHNSYLERVSIDEEKFSNIKNREEVFVVRNEFDNDSLLTIASQIIKMLYHNGKQNRENFKGE